VDAPPLQSLPPLPPPPLPPPSRTTRCRRSAPRDPCSSSLARSSGAGPSSAPNPRVPEEGEQDDQHFEQLVAAVEKLSKMEDDAKNAALDAQFDMDTELARARSLEDGGFDSSDDEE